MNEPLYFDLTVCGLSLNQQWEFHRLFNMPMAQHPDALKAMEADARTRFAAYGLVLPSVVIAFLKHQTLDAFIAEHGYVPIRNTGEEDNS